MYKRAIQFNSNVTDVKEVQTEYIIYNKLSLSLLSSTINKCPIWYTYTAKEGEGLTLSSDASLIATGGFNCVMIWDARTAALVCELLFDFKFYLRDIVRDTPFICFSPNNKFLVAMIIEYKIFIWKLETNAKVFEILYPRDHPEQLASDIAAFTEDSKKIVIQSGQFLVSTYCLMEHKCITEINVQEYGDIVKLSPNGNFILCIKMSNINICNSNDECIVAKISLNESYSSLNKFVFSHNSKKLIYTCIRKGIVDFDLRFQS